jgi:colanic acid biosynthesis glycosyl transferase WcaI
MRILVHTIFYRPELTGVARYTSELCEWLAARGHEVRVIAPPPYYPQWRVQPPYRAWKYSMEALFGVTVKRCPIWVPENPRGWRRILYAASFALSSATAVIKEALRGTDLVIVIEPSLLNAPFALLAARITGAKAWLHVQDLEINLAFRLGQLRFARDFLLWFEGVLIRRFDTVSTISEAMKRRIREKGVAGSRLLLLPNWIENAVAIPPKPAPRIVAMLSGTLGAKQGIEIILEAARLLKDDRRIIFAICGDGPAAPALRRLAADLPNIRFLPLAPADRVAERLSIADIHVLPQNKAAAELVLPSKLIGMLASGRPVVACADPGTEIAQMVQGCGRVVPPGDAEALAAAITELSANFAERERLGAAARCRALEQFEKSRILNAWERALGAPGMTEEVRARTARAT